MKLKRPEIYQTFMVYLDVDDYNQICEIQNLPIGTIKSRINRARKFIQENISEEDLLTLT
jgi:DNA-directed RNA polymerase specialized sigma24 family protein